MLSNIILGCVLLVAVLFSLYYAFLSHKAYKNNSKVSSELDVLMKETLEIVKKSRAAVKQQKKTGFLAMSDGDATMKGSLDEELADPAVLATIVTVLVKKFGDCRLSINDFMIPDTEFVSVYVDSGTQEIILSTDKNLASSESYLMSSYVDPDDSTFH
tara:strand:+ start:974 stop:1447 length:474 start_codon:yes stop_codon:yes gene_type:complete